MQAEPPFHKARLCDLFNAFISFIGHYNKLHFKSDEHVAYLFYLARHLERTAESLVLQKSDGEFNAKLVAYLGHEEHVIYNVAFFTKACDRLLEAFLLDFDEMSDANMIVATNCYRAVCPVERLEDVFSQILSDAILLETVNAAIDEHDLCD